MRFTASAYSETGGLRQQIDVNGRHTIATDEPTAIGGTDTAPAPHELLPAMLASCVSTTLELYARRHGWRLDGLRVDVTYDPDATPRKVRLTVRLPEGLSSEQLLRLRRVAAACPARRSLEAGFVFDERLASDSVTSE
jgi:putative redox protein